MTHRLGLRGNHHEQDPGADGTANRGELLTKIAWEISRPDGMHFEERTGEAACRKFTYVTRRPPHGNPVHMHMRYGDERSSFESLLSMSDGPEDKTKLDPWWSVYCAEGRSGCDK